MPFYAHSSGAEGDWEFLAVHLREVALLASEFASCFGEAERGRLLGILHDLGKYGDLFQQRLHNQEKGIDHWSGGAWIALDPYHDVSIALAVEGHHVGLRQGAKSSLTRLNPATLRSAEAPRLSESNLQLLLDRLHCDGITLPPAVRDAPPIATEAVARMLDVRMLFSALTDADFLATERHFKPDQTVLRSGAEALDAETMVRKLQSHLGGVRSESTATALVRNLREDLLAACLAAAANPPGVYTLTSPTGSGKTLALLMFALEHARIHRLRRIVVVLPFLSIIDQTAAVYREALLESREGYLDRMRVLEDHSLADMTPPGGGPLNICGMRQRALLAENWDAPFVVTTSVQFLESLFSNSPAACRKLHRLAGSTIIFDEVQTLPLGIVVPTLAALSHLSNRYRATVVFSTATQPAFDNLDTHVRPLCVQGWNPREIVPPSLDLYSRARRVTTQWPEDGVSESMPDLAARMSAQRQALCIVNVKRDARELFLLLEHDNKDQVLHISTSLCPQHRKTVIAEIRRCLRADEPCLVVATQCVEAGVDLDFPVVYRALAPLDAIAQAAGRCNRNGRLPTGNLHVFRPAGLRYPSSDYKQATALTGEMLCAAGGHLDLDDPDVFRNYYRRLYALSSIEQHKPDLLEAIRALDFVEVRRLYRVIENADSINVLTAYDPEHYEVLAQRVRAESLSRRWVSDARPLTVGLFRPRGGGRLFDYLEPARLRDGSPAPDWFIHLRPEHYHPQLGLEVPEEMEFMCT
jgi:CRISPR-associated endonuclease/helicase Cas3